MVTSANPITAGHPSLQEDGRSLAAQPATHLVPLSNSWNAWRWIGLRGAGFPVHLVLGLSAPECSEAAICVLEREEKVNQAREKALAALRNLQQHSTQSTPAVKKAIHCIKTERQPVITAELVPASSQLADLAAAEKDLATAQGDYGKCCDAAWSKISEVIQQVARMPQFREAITWQNRSILHGSLASLLRDKNTRSSSDMRRQQELVARYMQRYCTKNDTIGFFGPVGWAKFSPGSSETITVKAGPSLLRRRKTYFEAWCVDELARCLSQREEMLPWAVVRRLPVLCLETATGRVDPLMGRLTEDESHVLKNLNSPAPAGEFVKELLDRQIPGLRSEEQVYTILTKLLELGLITWEFGGPLETAPEQRLRRQIAAIGDPALRSRAMGQLDQLEALRQEVENSAGNAEELDRAFGSLEEQFTQLTQMPGVRSGGRVYAGRSLVYEDCIRDAGVDLGQPFLQALAPPLELLLASARWFTYEMAKEYRKAFSEVYRRLVHETGNPVIDAAQFYFRIQALFFGSRVRIPQEVQRRLQSGWKQVLAAPPDARRVNYAVGELRQKVKELFDAPIPGWKLARYHSPDLMISVGNPEGIQRGEYEIVLGELHVAGNTLGSSFFFHQHPSPNELLLAYELDLPDSRVVPVSSKNWPGYTARTNPVLVSSKDFLLETGHDPSGAPPAQTLTIGEMRITESDGTLVVQSRNGERRFDIVEFFSGLLSGAAIANFTLLGDEPHTPRVTIDKLVLCRESWRLPVDELDFAQYRDTAEQFLCAQELRRAQGMPRFVFVKAPPESKPFYVDFDSPIFVAMFAKFVRRTKEADTNGRITISEMLPAPHQTWLPNAQGHRFTCELRMVAVDSCA